MKGETVASQLSYDNGEMVQIVKKYNLPLIAMHNQNDEFYKKDIISY